MCGRYVLVSPTSSLVEAFSITELPNLMPRYNITPTTPVLVLVDEKRHVRHMRWGLIPSWVKDPNDFTLLINARSETVATKPSFRNAFRRRRCIVPADGFYEWLRRDGQKQPFFLSRADGAMMAMAAIWEVWMGPDGEEMESVALLTTAANDDLAPIHDRMPVILEATCYDRWLSTPETQTDALTDLFDPAPAGTLTRQAVSTRVNSARNEGVELLEPVELEEPTALVVGQVNPKAQSPEDQEPRTSDQLSLF